MPFHYLLLSVYQEVQLPLCLSITITYYFLSIRRCGYPYANLLPLPITFCLSGGAVTITPGPAEGVWSSVWFGILHHSTPSLLHSTPGTGVRDPTS